MNATLEPEQAQSDRDDGNPPNVGLPRINKKRGTDE